MSILYQCASIHRYAMPKNLHPVHFSKARRNAGYRFLQSETCFWLIANRSKRRLVGSQTASASGAFVKQVQERRWGAALVAGLVGCVL